MNVVTADIIQYQELCCLLESISLQNNIHEKKKLFEIFIQKWFSVEAKTSNIYLILRLICHINDKKVYLYFDYDHLLDIINEDLGIHKDEFIEPEKLSLDMKISILEGKYPFKLDPSNISITFLSNIVDLILERQNVRKTITSLLKDMNKLEQKWFYIILMSNVEEITMLSFDDLISVIDPALKRLLDDGYYLEDLLNAYHPTTFVEEDFRNSVKIARIGKPFMPMEFSDFGPSRKDFTRIQKICKGKILAENYHHGDRIIMHRYNDGASVKFFSDTMEDWTEYYTSPDYYPFFQEIEPFFKDDIENVILDGQMLVICRNFKDILEKNSTLPDGSICDSKSVKAKNCQMKLCFWITDILYVNGEPLVKLSFENRMEILNNKIFDSRDKNIFRISQQTEIKNYEDFFEELKNSSIRMEEGFILRDSSSSYIFGRVPDDECFFKIKVDPKMFATLTMAVVGGEYYATESYDLVKKFLLAARDCNEKLVICNKVHAPVKRHLYNVLVDSLNINNSYFNELPYWLSSQIPSNQNTRYILQTYVTSVEIKWTRINPGSEELIYISAIKKDSPRRNISMISDVECIRKNLDEQLKDTKGIVQEEVKEINKNDNYISQTMPFVNKSPLQNNYFDGLTVCVLNCQKDFTTVQIARFIWYLGGFVISHPTSDVSFIIADDPLVLETKAVLELKCFPIVKSSWVVRCLKQKKVKKIDLQNEIFLHNGKEGLSIDCVNLLIKEKPIPFNILEAILL